MLYVLPLCGYVADSRLVIDFTLLDTPPNVMNCVNLGFHGDYFGICWGSMPAYYHRLLTNSYNCASTTMQHVMFYKALYRNLTYHCFHCSVLNFLYTL
jgi:hypothetical protein